MFTHLLDTGLADVDIATVTAMTSQKDRNHDLLLLLLVCIFCILGT